MRNPAARSVCHRTWVPRRSSRVLGHAYSTRLILALFVLGFLVLASLEMPLLSGGQAAVSLSRPGQEDLTFWVNNHGLEQVDIEGEVGFGDMARFLMRRRANRDKICSLRDRFTFRVQEMAAIDTPDVFHAEVQGGELIWRNRSLQYVVAAGRIFNLPLIIENRDDRSFEVQARFGTSSVSGVLAAKSAAGYFLKVQENKPGSAKGKLVLRAGEKEATAEITLDVRPLVKLRVYLVDENGKPVAARVYLTASDGLGYAPRGSISRFAAMSAEQYFHAQNFFELELPAGETLIEATRGQEYHLTARRVDLQPGRPAEVRLQLKRWENMAAKGWYSCDAHIHANYKGAGATAHHHQVVTPQDVRLQTLAEDLNNANMMVANSSDSFIHDVAFFEGRPHALSRPNYTIYWNEEMRNASMYGHMSFFNLKTLVHPIYTGFRDTPHWEDYPANYTQAQEARKQGGAVTYVHPGYRPTFDGASARELPVDLALGQVDAMDVLSNNPEEVGMELWYRLLNCGFKLAISAGTDSFTNIADHYTPGDGRVYVHLNGRMHYDDWIRHYREGRSFASNGPVLFFTVNGKEPGDELRFPEGLQQKLRLKALVRTLVPLHRVEVVVNGKSVISRLASEKKEIFIDETISLDRSSWIALRASGPWHRLILNDTHAFAHTSPVYVHFGNQRVAYIVDARFYMDWIKQLIRRVEQYGHFATVERKREVTELFRTALEIYRKIERRASGN